MTHKGTKTIETNRLILRQFRMSDAEIAFKNWFTDKNVTKFMTWQPHESIDASKELLKIWTSNYEKPDWYMWAIELKEISEPIGSISAVRIDEETSTPEIGYCIGYDWWHQGIMSEALGAVISYLFKETGAECIRARHAVENPNSGKVMKKCGMKYEGTLRKSGVCNYGITDLCVYSILKDEYKKDMV